MARKRIVKTGPTDQERDDALYGARAMTGYLLCAEIDHTRSDAVKAMGPAELRQVVAEEEDGIAPDWFRESILEDLDVAEGAPSVGGGVDADG